jgi:hypothetical protein
MRAQRLGALWSASSGWARAVAGACMVLCAAFLAGCGSTSSGTNTEPRTVTTTTATRQLHVTSSGSASQHPLGRTAYEQRMRTLGAQLSRVLGSLGDNNEAIANEGNVAGAGAKTAANQVVRNLRRAQVLLRRTAVKLNAIVPPPAVEMQHRELRKGVIDLADELTPVIVAVKRGALQSALPTIEAAKGIEEMHEATLVMARKGIPIT